MEKFNLRRRIPFGKPDQPIDDIWHEIVDFFEDPAHGEWLTFHLIHKCEMRWTGHRSVGHLIRQLLRPDVIKRVVWSSDARDQTKPIVPEVLQAFIESTIDAMLDAADLGKDRPKRRAIIQKCEKLFDNKRYADEAKAKKALKAAAKDGTSSADATGNLVIVEDDQVNILSESEYTTDCL